MKKIFSTILLTFVVAIISATPRGEEQARRIATEFFSGGTRAATAGVELVWSGSSLRKSASQHSTQTFSGDALLYIYNRSTAPGFVIISGDDHTRPVIAFSHERSFVLEQIPDGARDILTAWCEQIAATKVKQNSTPQQFSTRADGEELMYDTALWNQDDPFNRESPIYDGNRSVTGCVATAMAIIAYYHQWPERGVGTTPEYTYDTNRTIAANTLGRRYDYSAMLPYYNGNFTTTQANEVAALMYDMGTSVMMSFDPTGSAAHSLYVPTALSTYFGYSKGMLLIGRDNKTEAEWHSMLKENIKTYGPTYFAGNNTQTGHAFVLDGYNADNYFHINYGWGGNGNGFYWLPDIEYYNDQEAIFYLEPDKDGTSTYRDYLGLYSFTHNSTSYIGLDCSVAEYKLNEPFSCSVGGVYNCGSTDFNGDIRLVHCDKNGVVKEAFAPHNIKNLPIGYVTFNIELEMTLTTEIAEGDRLRLLYKGEHSSDWVWTRSMDSSSIDEILLKATPEEVAKTLKIQYSKSAKSLTFTSPNAIQYRVKSVTSDLVTTAASVAALTPTTIDCSALSGGEYIFEFASGGRPYQLNILF